MGFRDWLMLAIPWMALLALILWDVRDKDDKASTSPRRHDSFDAVNLFVLICTFLAAAAAAYEAGRLADLTDQLVRDGQASSKEQAELTRESNRLNREAVIASSRAWIGAVDAKLSGPIEVGKAVKVVVSVRNTGREPARNFRWVPSHFVGISDKVLAQDVETGLRFCFGTPASLFGQVIFPSTGLGNGADFGIEFSKDEIDGDVVSGAKVLIAQGCVAYETSGATRHSAFCFVFRSGVSVPEHLNICDVGSNAD